MIIEKIAKNVYQVQPSCSISKKNHQLKLLFDSFMCEKKKCFVSLRNNAGRGYFPWMLSVVLNLVITHKWRLAPLK